MIAEPLSVVHSDGERGTGAAGLRVEAPAFPAASEPSVAVPPAPAAEPDASGPPPAAPDAVPPPDPTLGLGLGPDPLADDPSVPPGGVPAPLRDLRVWLQSTSERGLSPAALPTASAELARLAGCASSAGLTLFGHFDRPAASVAELAEQVVKAHVLCMEYERAAASRVG